MHQDYALKFNAEYKYQNLARLFKIRWINPIEEVVRTPTSLILVTSEYQTTLQKMLTEDADGP